MLEVICAAIIAVWLFFRLRLEDDKARVLWRLLFFATGAWIGEDSCIRLYHFYAYSRDAWTLFVDEVPLLVLCIWPVVISSAWDLAGALVSSPRARSVVTALLVLADASLIEPISVQAGLWTWHEPGFFAVPPIGILGWSFYTLGAAWALSVGRPVLAVVVGPIVAHVLLLATWWGVFRWVNVPVPEVPVIVVLGLVSLWLAWRAPRANLPAFHLWLRAPAACFFFVLLARTGLGVPTLVAWVVVCAIPWWSVALSSLRRRRDGAVTTSG